MNARVEGLKKTLLMRAGFARATVAKWAGDLAVALEEDRDLAYPFRWSDEAATAAAVDYVFRFAASGLVDRANDDPIDPIAPVLEYARREMKLKASSPTRSTSVASTYQEREILAAWASVVETIEDYIR